MERIRQTRNVAILIYEQVEPLDFAGPFEAFICGSNRGADFNVFTVAEQSDPVIAVGNLSINPSYTIHNCPRPDLLIVPGGFGSRREMNNETLLNWIRTTSTQAELVLSVCTGALILARANLLEGLRITTNRSAFGELEKVAPESSTIVKDVRYVDNGQIILSAGVSAGIDMSLYAVGKLLGEDRAMEAARIMEYDYYTGVN